MVYLNKEILVIIVRALDILCFFELHMNNNLRIEENRERLLNIWALENGNSISNLGDSLKGKRIRPDIC